MRYLTLCIVLGFLTACSDVVHDTYKNYQQAVDDNLFERGWLPDFIPSSATHFEISNDLDVNHSWGSFYLPRADMPKFTEYLKLTKNNTYTYQDWTFTIDHQSGKVSYDMIYQQDKSLPN